MARLPRPYIPLSVRVVVAHRQLVAVDPAMAAAIMVPPQISAAERLAELLWHLFGNRPHALDHDPALVNRRRRIWADGSTTYTPRANDPLYLKYREAGPVGSGSEHDIKTRVRGERGQLSDLALARKEKRRKKKAAKRGLQRRQGLRVRASALGRPRSKIPSRPFPKGRKLRSVPRG